jgi:hypothetical protein
MGHLCIAIAAGAVLLAAGMAGRAGAAAVTPPLLGSEPLPYAYGAPHGYRPQPVYGPTSPYALAPYTYSLQRRHSRSPQYPPQHAFRASPGYGPGAEYAPAPAGYGPPSQADGLPPGYGLNPEYGRTHNSVPYAMPQDPNARFKVWNEIANSLTEALLQLRSVPSHNHLFASRSATRPR